MKVSIVTRVHNEASSPLLVFMIPSQSEYDRIVLYIALKSLIDAGKKTFLMTNNGHALIKYVQPMIFFPLILSTPRTASGALKQANRTPSL
jgi:hypothetical protein